MRTWKRKKKKPALAPSFIVAVGLVVTALIAAFVLQRTLPRREAVADRLPPPEFASLLPAGAEAAAGGALEIPDLPQSSYAVGFKAQDGNVAVALIAWDKQQNRYALASTLVLDAGGARLESVPTLSLMMLGRGAPLAIVAKGSAGAYTDGVFIIMRQGGKLRFVAKQDKDGKAGIAFFLSGASVMHSEQVDFGDVDGDGTKDAVVTQGDADDRGVKHEIVSAYVLKENVFTYDQELSHVLTLSKSVFPEPTAPSTLP
ncbi:MAG TPA: hypothetical protein VLC10_04385 [Patescibacteria group bacterium]|nr:hypothetical protein [Patescibacteria group bacterium]